MNLHEIGVFLLIFSIVGLTNLLTYLGSFILGTEGLEMTEELYDSAQSRALISVICLNLFIIGLLILRLS